MDNDELGVKLRARGHRIGTSVVRTDGMMLVQVDDVFMFRLDAVDLALGAATLDEILLRNEGKVFPDAPRR